MFNVLGDCRVLQPSAQLLLLSVLFCSSYTQSLSIRSARGSLFTVTVPAFGGTQRVSFKTNLGIDMCRVRPLPEPDRFIIFEHKI
jgi:hypothetical protein